MPVRQRTLGFLLTPRWIILQAVVIAFVLSCYFLLAPWQFARSSQHSEEQIAINNAIAAGAAPISELMSTSDAPDEETEWREVTATGHYDTDHQVYIRLRHDRGGQPAFEVVTPFVTEQGVTVLVDRGYVPFRMIQEGGSAADPPSGTVTIAGRVQAEQTDPKDRPPSDAPDGTRAYLATNSRIVADLLGSPTPTYRGYIALSEDQPGVLDPIGLPVDNSRPFFSYALQWLGFGGIAVIGLIYFIYREAVDPSDEDIYVPREWAGVGGPDATPGDAVSDTADGGMTASATEPAPDEVSVGMTSSPAQHGPERAEHSSKRAKRAKFDKSQLYD